MFKCFHFFSVHAVKLFAAAAKCNRSTDIVLSQYLCKLALFRGILNQQFRQRC